MCKILSFFFQWMKDDFVTQGQAWFISLEKGGFHQNINLGRGAREPQRLAIIAK